MAQWETNPTGIHEDTGLIPSLDHWVKDPVLPWLWCRPAAVAPIGPRAWEFPYAIGMALKRKKVALHSFWRLSTLFLLVATLFL